MYKLIYSAHFKRDFKKLPVFIKKQVLFAISKLQTDPFRHTKKLEGEKFGIYRVRKGIYRIRYDVRKKKKEVWLHSVRHRREVYR